MDPEFGNKLSGIPREVFTIRQLVTISRWNDPINPKVAPIVEALNRVGFRTQMSGDLYGDKLIYVDFYDITDIPLHKLPAPWILTAQDWELTEEHVDKGAGFNTTNRSPDTGHGYRIARPGGAASREEAESLVFALTGTKVELACIPHNDLEVKKATR